MNFKSRIVVVVAVTMVIALDGIRAAGQNEPAASAPTATEQAPAQKPESADQLDAKSVGGMIVSGGTLNIVFFAILGVFSLWAATVVLERIFNLRRDKFLPASFTRGFSQLIESSHPNTQEFQALCESNVAPISRIFQAGVARSGRPLSEVEKAMEDAAAREMAAIRAKSRPLSVVGNIAPLVGLLGTVVGMIMAFQISSQEGLGKAERLAEGIYLALMTTAAGLTIAIPCLLFASWFQGRAERYMCDIGECLTAAMPCFARMEGKHVATTVVKHLANAEGIRVSTPVENLSPDQELSPREKFLREGAIE